MTNTRLKNILSYFKGIFPILCFLSINSISQAQPLKAWDKGYGGEGYEDCNAAIQTTDLGYLLGGVTSSDVSGDIADPTYDDLSIPWWFLHVRGDFWALRTDEDGNMLWEARFGGNKEDRMWGVQETSDGGFLLGGQSYSDMSGTKTDTSRGDSDYWIVKIDALGNYQWDKTYGGDSTDILNVLIETQDGGFMLGGWSISSGWSATDSLGEKSDTLRGDYDWWIVKIDALGTIEWEKSYGGNDTEQLSDIVQREDGSYIIAGGTDSDISGEVTEPSRGLRDYWLLHIDPLGTILNEYRYGGDGFDDLNRVILSSDSTYVLAGSSLTMNPSGDKTEAGFGSFDWWTLKIDTLGAIKWQHTFGGSDLENVYSLSQNSVDYYLLGGLSRSVDGTLADNPTKGDYDYWIMYLDPAGNRVWDERYGGDEAESLEQLFQTEDGGYLLAGHSRTDVSGDKEDPTEGGNDFWIVKTLCNINVELNDTIVCPGDPVLISAYDPNCTDCTYAWSDNNSIQDSIRLVSTMDATAYSVTLTDGVGCLRSDEININVHTPPSVELGADALICSGDTFTLDAGNAGLDFNWNTSSASQSIEVFYPGNYAVTVTDAIGCETPDSLRLALSDLQADVTTINTTCGLDNGTATVVASGGTGNYTYVWNTGALGNSISGLATGTYEVAVSDGDCVVFVSAIVGFEEAPVLEWEQNYGGSLGDKINEIKETPDDGYMMLGISFSADNDLSVNAGNGDFWATKLDGNGGIEWQRTYGGAERDEGKTVIVKPDGGYLFVGDTRSADGDIGTLKGTESVWLLSTNAAGDILWEQTYGGSGSEENYSAIPTLDGGYILANISNSTDGDISNPLGAYDIWIVKIDANGTMIWEANYGGSGDETLPHIQETLDGGYFIGASSDSGLPNNLGLNDYMILRTDAKGTLLWQYNYGGSGQDLFRDFEQTDDGGLLLFGTTASNDFNVSDNNGSNDFWLVKVDQAGILEWQETIGGALSDDGYRIDRTGDGNFFISGIAQSTDGDFNGGIGFNDYTVLKISPQGNILWDQKYGSSMSESFIANSLQTKDGGYLIAGVSEGADNDVSANYGNTDYWLLKLNAPLSPTVTLPSDLTSCALDTLTFAPSISDCLACTWQWNDANNDSIRVVTPALTSNYEIIVTDIYGCTASANINVHVNALPLVNLGNTINLCAGSSQTLDAGTDGNAYSWSTHESTQLIEVDTAAIYRVTVTNANACSAQDSVDLIIVDLPMVDLGADTSACDGQTFILDAENPGATYQWSVAGANNQTLAVTVADNYSVTVTDNNNCSAEDAINIDFGLLPQAVTLESLGLGPFCPGTSFDINIENSENGVLYELFDGNTIAGGSALGNGGILSIPTDAIPTSTTFNIVASFDGMCADTLSASVFANIGDVEAPIIDCRTDTIIRIEDGNCDPVLNIAAPVTSSDNCAIESILYSFSGATNLASPLTGIHDASGETLNVGVTMITYTVIDSAGNSNTCDFTVEVIDLTNPLVGEEAMDLTVECDGAGNSNAFNDWLLNHGGATAFDACSPLSWSTVPANPTLSDGCGETGSVEVTFVATDTSGNAVSSTAIFTIEDTQAPSFTVPADITIGANDDWTDLSITGDVTDEADNCDGGVSDQGPRVATYTDVISTDDCADVISRTWVLSDECGNMESAIQTIQQDFAAPSASLSGAVAICPGEPVDLTFNLAGASNVFNVVYRESISNVEINLSNISDGHTIQVMPMETTTYSIVSVVDVNRIGCQGSIGNEVEVIVHSIPEAINIQETCDLLNTSYVITFELAGGEADSYIVTGDAGQLNGHVFTSQSIARNTPYTFFIDDGNGCGPIEISGTHDCQCETEAGSIQATNLAACGTEAINASHVGSNLDANDSLEFVVHDGTAAMIGTTVFYRTSTPTFTLQGTMQYGITYFVTVIASTADANGNVTDIDACYSESLGVPIIFHEPPTAVIMPVTDTELDCVETSLELSAATSQAQGSISFEWTTEDGNIILGQDSEVAGVDEVGFYNVEITDNLTGCMASNNIEVTADEALPVVVVATPDELTCLLTTSQLNANGSSTGSDFEYQWSGGLIESGAQTLTPIVSESANYTLLVTNTANGCTASEQVFVDTNFDAPLVDAGLSQALNCSNTTLTLQGTYTGSIANYSIEWTANPGNIIAGANTLTPTIDEEGIYTLVVTNNATGCPGQSEVLISLNEDMPQGIELETFDPLCYGDENGRINILNVVGGTAPFSYSFDGLSFYEDTTFNNLAPGNYNLTLQDAAGCEWDTLLALDFPNELMVDLGDNFELDLGDSIRLDAFVNEAIDTFVWNIPFLQSLSPMIQPANQTTYHVEVTNAAGCTAEDFVTVVVRKDRNVYIPTAFSPNGDGFNDFFTLYADQSVLTIRNFRVFNRWGETLFARADFNPNVEQLGWDGRLRGKDLQTGVYVFFAEIEFFDGRVEVYKGDITLLR